MKDFAFTQEDADTADLILIARDGEAHWGSQLSDTAAAALLRKIADDIDAQAAKNV